jgi:enamine deaminase RidA (YjgF/YER057c/UK114 family)
MDKTHVRLISPPGLHKPAGYSHVAEVTAGTLIYVAGQVALDAGGNLVGAHDFAAQVRQVFANLTTALGSVGATFKDVIKLNYYCADSIDPAIHLPTVRAVRDALVDPEAPPASTFVVVRRLVNPEWLIEVEAVAVVRL